MVRDGRLRGVPHHGVGRPAKVGKEAIVGLLTALRRYLARDEGAEIDRQIAILAAIAGRLEEGGLPPGASLLLRRPPIDGRVTYPGAVAGPGRTGRHGSGRGRRRWRSRRATRRSTPARAGSTRA